MSIKHKMVLNFIFFLLAAIWFAYRELLMFHSDLFFSW